jgi:hypothetical protein
MGWDCGVIVFMGVCLPIYGYGDKRDVELFRKVDPIHYNKLKKNDALEDLYCDISLEPIKESNYYFFNAEYTGRDDIEITKYFYYGLYTFNHVVRRSTVGIKQHTFPSQIEIDKFLEDCKNKDIDTSSFGTYTICYSSE